MLYVHAESSSAITTGQPSKCVWLPIQLPYGEVNSIMDTLQLVVDGC